MKRFRTYLLVAIGFVLAGAIGAAFGTRRAEAVVATLVEIVNPATSPLPTSSVDATDPGRIAYQSTLSIGLGGTGCSGEVCSLSFPPVLAGHRVVVQQISVFANITTPALGPADIRISLNGSLLLEFTVPASPNTLAFVQPLQLALDPSNSVRVSVGNNDVVFAPPFSVTLTGYELDCTVATCAPIAAE